MTNRLILVTNDDGIESNGLRAAVESLLPLGDLCVVAPNKQWSGAGRAMPGFVSGDLVPTPYETYMGIHIPAYAMDTSPALCIVHAVLEILNRKPDLVVSGINYGENISTEITISGTIGAAMEAAAFGIPALAVSLAMPVSAHLHGSDSIDYAAARSYTQVFARRMLEKHMPADVDVISINLPQDAVPDTPWRMTRLSRARYFIPLAPDRENGIGRPGYKIMTDPSQAEAHSDVWCLHVDHMVSVTPLSLDMTARADFGHVEETLRSRW
ncbi:MAG: 5'/3'-nucleotidase SurE [Anaerolineae bacterium]|nr:5'/3'-nucleotidase SurE [Anaerolineae bacterium]